MSRRSFLAGTMAFGITTLVPSCAEAGLNPAEHLFVVGDLHLTRNDPAVKREALLSSLASLSGHSPGFHVIFNGDILEFPDQAMMCANGGWQWEEFAKVCEGLEKAGFVPHLVFGNHDGSEEFARKMMEGIVPQESMGNSSFRMGNGTKAVLLSALHPSGLDADFLASEMRGSGPMFVACHFPPDPLTHTPGRTPRAFYDIWNRKEILHMMSEADIPLVCSHAHAPYMGTYGSPALRRPIRVMCTASLTYTLPYRGTDSPPERVFGITVLDSRRFNGEFFDAEKRFGPPRFSVQSPRGTYAPRPLRRFCRMG